MSKKKIKTQNMLTCKKFNKMHFLVSEIDVIYMQRKGSDERIQD